VILLLLSCTSSNSKWIHGPLAGAAVRPIAEGMILPWDALTAAWSALWGADDTSGQAGEDLVRFGSVSAAARIAHAVIPEHPFMAANRGNNMHCDAYMSDTYAASGPLGNDPQIRSRTQGFGGYGTVTFDSLGRLVAVYSNGRGFELELMNPHSLEELASHKLPGRPWYWLLQGILPWKYIGAGMYFYLDHLDRAIVPTTRNTIQVIQTPGDGGQFELVREYNLADHVVPSRWPHSDSVAWVLPDWAGNVYWYATTRGMVGTVDVLTGEVRSLRVEGEIIENSFAVAEEGVYILTDHAFYRFSLDKEGHIAIDWRTPYDRGPAQKPGHITRGSGTSVSLVGDEEGLAVITDNAEPRIHLLFVRRSDGTVVCSTPLFEEGRSGTDVSVACFEHADAEGKGRGVYSVVVENNWGHHSFPHSRPEPGLARVDLVRAEDGTFHCETIWENPVRGICVFKLSLGSGLVYTYWRSEACPTTVWYLTAIDFASGETVFRKRVGTGLGFNSWAGALFLHPDGQIAYSTTIFGLVMIRDEGG